MIIPVFLSPVHFIRGNFHRHITRAPLRTLAYRLSANRQGPSRHFPAPIPHIKEGCLAALDFVSCKPPQKLAVSKHLHAGSSPAWRLNSALRASNNAARTCGRSSPVQKQETAQFFHRPSGKGIRPSPLSFPQRHAGSPDRGRACAQGDGTWRPRQNNTKIKRG